MKEGREGKTGEFQEKQAMKMVTVVQGEWPDSHRTPSQLSSLSLPAHS